MLKIFEKINIRGVYENTQTSVINIDELIKGYIDNFINIKGGLSG